MRANHLVQWLTMCIWSVRLLLGWILLAGAVDREGSVALIGLRAYLGTRENGQAAIMSACTHATQPPNRNVAEDGIPPIVPSSAYEKGHLPQLPSGGLLPEAITHNTGAIDVF